MKNQDKCSTCYGSGQVTPDTYDKTPAYLRPIRYPVDHVECRRCMGKGFIRDDESVAPMMMSFAIDEKVDTVDMMKSVLRSRMSREKDKVYTTYTTNGVAANQVYSRALEENPYVPGAIDPYAPDTDIHMDHFNRGYAPIASQFSGKSYE